MNKKIIIMSLFACNYTLYAQTIAPYSCTGEINSSSFSIQKDFPTAQGESYFTALGDLNGDGKIDLVAANYSGSTISVFRNTSLNGEITASSFAEQIPFQSGGAPSGIAIGDLDDDGRLDVAVTNQNSNSVSVFRNISTNGTINLEKIIGDLHTTTTPAGVAIGDLNGDGKPEIVAANNGQNFSNPSFSVSVFKNTTLSGLPNNITFDPKQDFETGLHPFGVVLSDLNQDGKAELILANGGSSSISILKNITSNGTIEFEPKLDLPSGSGSTDRVAVGDFDGDGKPDLANVNLHDNSFSVFKNIGTQSIIAFESKIEFATNNRPLGLATSDLDGDGKTDIVVANEPSGAISVFKNISSSGLISFAPKVDYPKSGLSYEPIIGDIDGDGKPDIVVGNGTNSVAVFQNLIPAILNADLTTSNNRLYFGYSGDQTALIKVTPSGGIGPYSVTISMNRSLTCNSINSAGDEKWVNGSSTTSNINLNCPASGPSLGLPTAIGNVSSEGDFQITVTLMQDAIFYATIIDANGCLVTKNVHIDAEDVRCFSGNSNVQKVTLCHKTGSNKNPCVTICVNEDVVYEHMAHGDYLGSCNSTCIEQPVNARTNSDTEKIVDINEILSVEAYPNPIKSTLKVRIANTTSSNVKINVIDTRGRTLNIKYSEPTPDGIYEINTEELQTGLYLLLINTGINAKTIKLIKE